MSQNSQLHSNTWTVSYFPGLTSYFPPREKIINWFDQRRRQIWATPLERETEWCCNIFIIFFSPAVPKPPHGHFELSPVSLASRDQYSGPSNSINDWHLRCHSKIGDCEHMLSSVNPIQTEQLVFGLLDPRIGGLKALALRALYLLEY